MATVHLRRFSNYSRLIVVTACTDHYGGQHAHRNTRRSGQLGLQCLAARPDEGQVLAEPEEEVSYRHHCGHAAVCG